MVRMRKHDEYDTEILSKGHHFIDAELNELVFFIRRNKAVPMFEPAENTGEINYKRFKMLGYSDCNYTLYKDNGISADPKESLEIIDCR